MLNAPSVKKSLIVFVLSLGFAGHSHAQELPLQPYNARCQIEAEWNERHERLTNLSAVEPDHAWAGTYYCGDGLGVNLTMTLSPNGEFAFRWTGCMGIYDRNMGTFSIGEDGVMTLEFELENNREGFRGSGEAFIPIRWGERRYLVAKERLASFCDAVNLGSEPRDGPHGGVYLREGDWDLAVTGAPDLPEAAAAMVLPHRVNAKVVLVGEAIEGESAFGGRPVLHTPITLDKGKNDGLVLGITLRSDRPCRSYGFCTARITSVARDSCDAVIEHSASDEFTPPEVGWVFGAGRDLKPLNEIERALGN